MARLLLVCLLAVATGMLLAIVVPDTVPGYTVNGIVIAVVEEPIDVDVGPQNAVTVCRKVARMAKSQAKPVLKNPMAASVDMINERWVHSLAVETMAKPGGAQLKIGLFGRPVLLYC